MHYALVSFAMWLAQQSDGCNQVLQPKPTELRIPKGEVPTDITEIPQRKPQKLLPKSGKPG